MNNSFARLIDGMCATLRSEVLTRLDDEFARGQVFGVINLLNTFKTRADWSAGFLLEQIAAQHQAFDALRPLVGIPLPDEPLPEVAPAAELLARRNAPEQDLFWLRYPWAKVFNGDDFTRRFDVALVLGTRSLAMDGSFSLRRPEGTVFAPQDASATFRLTGAAAGVLRDSGYQLENLQITEGSLAVDFARATFASSLTAVGPQLGTSQIQATGAIDATGAMRSTAGNSLMLGGFNGDGHKAGLSFRRDVPGGVLLGISQWNR